MNSSKICAILFSCIFNNEKNNFYFCFSQFKYASCARTMFLCLSYMGLMAYKPYFHWQINKFSIDKFL